MRKSNKFSPEVRDCAVSMVQEQSLEARLCGYSLGAGKIVLEREIGIKAVRPPI